MAVTIKSIADKLKLSRNTVSKALNGGKVPEKTRELVLKTAQEMNYKYTALDSYKKYRILLVSAKPLSNINYFISLIGSIEGFCYEKQYDLFQYTFNKNNTFVKFSNYVKELNIDGIVAIECFDKDFILELLKLDIPICFHDFAHTSKQFPYNYDIIMLNDEQSINSIVKSIHQKYKATKFCFVGDNRHCHSFRKRYTGMQLGLLNLKINHSISDDINNSENVFDYSNPNEIKNAILKLKELPEVFICCNDFVARNVCIALKDLNIKIPDETLVVGFDNVTEAYSLSPTITSFSIDKQYLSLEIMRVLLDRIENKNIPSRVITLSTTLCLRESTNR